MAVQIIGNQPLVVPPLARGGGRVPQSTPVSDFLQTMALLQNLALSQQIAQDRRAASQTQQQLQLSELTERERGRVVTFLGRRFSEAKDAAGKEFNKALESQFTKPFAAGIKESNRFLRSTLTSALDQLEADKPDAAARTLNRLVGGDLLERVNNILKKPGGSISIEDIGFIQGVQQNLVDAGQAHEGLAEVVSPLLRRLNIHAPELLRFDPLTEGAKRISPFGEFQLQNLEQQRLSLQNRITQLNSAESFRNLFGQFTQKNPFDIPKFETFTGSLGDPSLTGVSFDPISLSSVVGEDGTTSKEEAVATAKMLTDPSSLTATDVATMAQAAIKSGPVTLEQNLRNLVPVFGAVSRTPAEDIINMFTPQESRPPSGPIEPLAPGFVAAPSRQGIQDALQRNVEESARALGFLPSTSRPAAVSPFNQQQQPAVLNQIPPLEDRIMHDFSGILAGPLSSPFVDPRMFFPPPGLGF